ncbi:MAG: T9SS type A sorting domain-containing protein [Bacteroidetes bacterium]|nr:T9SS type A sorting domain-containing protein [Bacteroidota bacterium]
MKKFLTLILLILGLNASLRAQFAPAAGLPGSTAIHKDSSILVLGADSVWISRGLLNIADSSLGFPSIGDSLSAVGRAGENGVVSLGDGGMAVAWFRNPIKNGPGFDFAVFENGFEIPGTSTWHMELAFVEVSKDGKQFFRFPPRSLVDTLNQLDNFSGMNPALVNNLAGKYSAGYGTPFDLEELKDSLDVNLIQYVRIIDVVGSLNPAYGSRDAAGSLINDPWPTPFPSSGFDLDAIVAIHQIVIDNVSEINRPSFSVYPNPVQQQGTLGLQGLTKTVQLELFDWQGKLVQAYTLSPDQPNIPAPEIPGIYVCHIHADASIQTLKLIVLP